MRTLVFDILAGGHSSAIARLSAAFQAGLVIGCERSVGIDLTSQPADLAAARHLRGPHAALHTLRRITRGSRRRDRCGRVRRAALGPSSSLGRLREADAPRDGTVAAEG